MLVFKEPNFVCRVADGDRPEKKFSRLIFAKDENEAREILQKRHYEVHRVRPYDFATKWKKATDRAKKEAQKKRGSADPKKRKPYKFPALWSPLKEVLLDLFHDKCAYCDAAFPHVEYGDIEHFRPKAEVTGDDDHPGYWWLAYDPNNYMPSCQLCNQGNAKKNNFPVSGTRALGPADNLAAEEPDLLNPYQDDFSNHVQFRPSITGALDAGRAHPTTPRGKASIDVYRLNRPRLWEIRLNEQRNALQQYRQSYSIWILNDMSDSLSAFVNSCISGERQFARAAIAEVKAFAAAKGHASPFP